MPDLSASWDIPNVFGLLCSDFQYDVDSYRVALGFLSDLAGGTIEADALTGNGGDPAMLIGWRRSEKFRRVYAKCRAAGEAEREATRRAETASATTEWQDPTQPPGQVFIPLSEAPVNRSAFSHNPSAGTWGG